MKLTELSKNELCELIKRISDSGFYFRFAIDNYLRERWEKKNNELLSELNKVDIIKDFKKFQRINKQLDKLHNDSDYYLQLDELKGGK